MRSISIWFGLVMLVSACAKNGDWGRLGYEAAQAHDKYSNGPNSEAAQQPRMSYDEYKYATGDLKR